MGATKLIDDIFIFTKQNVFPGLRDYCFLIKVGAIHVHSVIKLLSTYLVFIDSMAYKIWGKPSNVPRDF